MGVREGRDICIHIADSLHCTAETNTALQSNYTSIKKKNPSHTGFGSFRSSTQVPDLLPFMCSYLPTLGS